MESSEALSSHERIPAKFDDEKPTKIPRHAPFHRCCDRELASLTGLIQLFVSTTAKNLTALRKFHPEFSGIP